MKKRTLKILSKLYLPGTRTMNEGSIKYSVLNIFRNSSILCPSPYEIISGDSLSVGTYMSLSVSLMFQKNINCLQGL